MEGYEDTNAEGVEDTNTKLEF